MGTFNRLKPVMALGGKRSAVCFGAALCGLALLLIHAPHREDVVLQDGSALIHEQPPAPFPESAAPAYGAHQDMRRDVDWSEDMMPPVPDAQQSALLTADTQGKPGS